MPDRKSKLSEFIEQLERGVTGSSDIPASRIPLAIKIAHTVFLCILVPVYWREYGPGNFLWFSDIALFVVLFALWLESPFLASMQAVSVTLIESAWMADFLGRLLFGVGFVGGLSKYMFDAEIHWFVRGLSLFHVWLPFLLLWMVWRLGYNRDAWLAQTLLAWIVLPWCFFFTDPVENINWVFGAGEMPQRQLPAGVYFILVMLFFPVCVYLPTHLALLKLAPRAPDTAKRRPKDDE